tara:strand:- start:31 stop:291 length:261 start_codon:yes stop_codon:yes gene_type:complete
MEIIAEKRSSLLRNAKRKTKKNNWELAWQMVNEFRKRRGLLEYPTDFANDKNVARMYSDTFAFIEGIKEPTDLINKNLNRSAYYGC